MRLFVPQTKSLGQTLLSEVFQRGNLIENDYFGLEFQNTQMNWVCIGVCVWLSATLFVTRCSDSALLLTRLTSDQAGSWSYVDLLGHPSGLGGSIRKKLGRRRLQDCCLHLGFFHSLNNDLRLHVGRFVSGSRASQSSVYTKLSTSHIFCPEANLVMT